MDDTLFRALLFENEGTRLDFKQQQYRFVRAGDEEKSELLKDLLAFANAWRQEPAYILVGIGADKAGERQLLGIDPSEHVDDAVLQQFVNGKLNRELTFAYRPFWYDGKTFGVFEIPVQARPTFANRDYGRVRKHIVYFRRGSSTAEASPEIIAQMGRDDATVGSTNQPSLIVEFADVEARAARGPSMGLRARRHEEHNPRDLPDLVDTPTHGLHGILTPRFYSSRATFWRELAECVRDWRRFSSFGLLIRNRSSTPAEDTRVTLRVGRGAIELRGPHDMPDYPEPHYNQFTTTTPRAAYLLSGRRRGVPVIELQGDQWEIVIEPGRIRPQETIWVPEPIFISSPLTLDVELQVTAYAANLKEPMTASLQLRVEVEGTGALTIDELEKINDAHELEALKRKGLARETEDADDDG